jgi:uncharacterized membrane protein
MICSHCATEMPEISVYCPSCGRSVRDDEDEKVAIDTRDALLGSLAYVALIPAIVFLSVPPLRPSQFIRFHAWQSILFTVVAVILGLLMRLLFAILSIFPVVGLLLAWLTAGVVFLGIVVCWAVLVVKAGQGYVYELPWLERLAWHLAGREQA